MADVTGENGGMPHDYRARLERVAGGDGDTATVRLAGEVDVATAGSLQPELDSIVAEGPRTVVFDLTELEFMDSSGITLLLGVAGSVERVEVQNPSRAVRRLLELSGLADTFGLS